MPNLYDYKFIIILHVILCLNEREIEEQKEKMKRKIIYQEDQMFELTFNFHGALSILTFSKNKLTLFTKKNKRKAKEKKTKKRENKRENKKKKKKKNRGEIRRKKKKKKIFCLCPVFEKSILCDLLKTYLLIPLFIN